MTKIIGHRGFSSQAPENTLMAIELAIRLNCDYFEIDIQSSQDGVPYLLHDDTLDRTSSNFTGFISDYHSSELQDCFVGFPLKFGNQFFHEQLPTLEQALLLAKGRIKVCIELKNPILAKAIHNLLVRLEMVRSVIIFSFHFECLEVLQRLDASLKLLLLTEKISSLDFEKANKIQAVGLGIDVGNELSPALLKTFTKHRLECWVYTVNELKKMEACFKQNVHGIITDYPDLAKVFSYE